MPGSLATNFHEGSRSEYLAQFAFSAFGTAVPIPHQEDTGLDIYCTLLESVGQRSWPRAYYSVQVKSTLDDWVFDSAESVRWLIEHPLPIFLCVVDKREARFLVYPTTPRFAMWALPIKADRLVLTPGTRAQGRSANWSSVDSFELEAPILNFTIQDVLEKSSRDELAKVLKFWIDYDLENIFRIRSGIPHMRAPSDYQTNSTEVSSMMGQGMLFSEDKFTVAQGRFNELMSHLASHFFREKDMMSASLLAMLLRHFSPESSKAGEFNLHDPSLHHSLNQMYGSASTAYLYDAADRMLKALKNELGRHGIVDAQQ